MHKDMVGLAPILSAHTFVVCEEVRQTLAKHIGASEKNPIVSIYHVRASIPFGSALSKAEGSRRNNSNQKLDKSTREVIDRHPLTAVFLQRRGDRRLTIIGAFCLRSVKHPEQDWSLAAELLHQHGIPVLIDDASIVDCLESRIGEVYDDRRYASFSTDLVKHGQGMVHIAIQDALAEIYSEHEESPMVVGEVALTKLFPESDSKSDFDVLIGTSPPLSVPLLAIEVDGPHHRTDNEYIPQDRKKDALCEHNDMTLLRVRIDDVDQIEDHIGMLTRIIIIALNRIRETGIERHRHAALVHRLASAMDNPRTFLLVPDYEDIADLLYALSGEVKGLRKEKKELQAECKSLEGDLDYYRYGTYLQMEEWEARAPDPYIVGVENQITRSREGELTTRARTVSELANHSRVQECMTKQEMGDGLYCEYAYWVNWSDERISSTERSMVIPHITFVGYRSGELQADVERYLQSLFRNQLESDTQLWSELLRELSGKHREFSAEEDRYDEDKVLRDALSKQGAHLEKYLIEKIVGASIHLLQAEKVIEITPPKIFEESKWVLLGGSDNFGKWKYEDNRVVRTVRYDERFDVICELAEVLSYEVRKSVMREVGQIQWRLRAAIRAQSQGPEHTRSALDVLDSISSLIVESYRAPTGYR